MQSSLLWHKTVKLCLEDDEFKLNKCDPCVANLGVNGKQCTVCWYVDNNKTSHVDPKVVDSIIRMVEDKFGVMTKRRGKKYIFVGMGIEFADEGRVKILMKENSVLFGEDLARRPTP